MNLFDLFKVGKIALSDKGAVETLITQAKLMEGPKPSWKTGEFWVNQVVPTIALIAGGLSGFIPATWFVGGMLVIAAIGYLGRTALKMVHAWAAKGAAGLTDPTVLDDLKNTASTLMSVAGALKDVKAGNLDTAKSVTDTMNAPVTVNVSAAPPTQ